ncbi:MAG: hypothetical protein AB8B63_07355 [Granulosicoccus sp.]
MDAFAFIDLYCERTASGLWNEPLNALSNTAFVIAAGWAWLGYRRACGRSVDLLLIVLAGNIGIASLLFHTFATAWAELADVIAIWVFAAAYTLVTVHRLCGENHKRSFAVLCMIGVVIWLIIPLTRELGFDSNENRWILNGSIQYLPALLLMLTFSIAMAMVKHPARWHFILCTLIFLAALVFRTIDLMACSTTFGVGTHFIWHLLNATMIGLLLHLQIKYLAAQEQSP